MSPTSSRLLRWGILALILHLPAAAWAHDIDVTGVARIMLDELDNNQYHLSIVDQQVPPLYNLQYSLPDKCQVSTPSRYSYRFQCDTPLSIDDSLTFPWSLQGVVVVARWLDGSDISGYFPGDGSIVRVPLSELQADAGSVLNLAGRYLVLGAEHILFGFDHLLFIAGLLLLVQGNWALLKTVTAFTVAHSITLASAVLGYIPLQNAPIEILIALSIVLLAREIIMGHRGHKTLVHSKPWLVAFIFGLVHGFGFAGALGELGLRSEDIPLALLFFNVGVEAGQVLFIALVLALLLAPRQMNLISAVKFQSTSAYLLGGIATFWFLQRLTPLLIS